MVYNVFCASAAVAAFRRAAHVYAYSIAVWNRECAHIKPKKAMRFTKCDVCTMANEALDAQRRKGGSGWLTDEMDTIRNHLRDHYEVSIGVAAFSCRGILVNVVDLGALL